MSNVAYEFEDTVGHGFLSNGLEFLFDRNDFPLIANTKWYTSHESGRPYLIDKNGKKFHQYLFRYSGGLEVDHINLDTLDNRRCNLRLCTHQQNQINQPLQRNNTSGVSGVRYYAPRQKYVARIKICQQDIHLGYYKTMLEATQARNVGMGCMFGEYGLYNDVPPAPKWIQEKVIKQCERFAELSVCRAFLVFCGKEVANETE